jgi:hypothetical protein
MTRWLVSLLLAAAALGTALAKDSGALPLKRLSLGEIGGWIELEVRVEGVPSRWLLDTGSTRHIVSRAWAVRRGLVPGASVSASTALGSLQGQAVDLPPLWLGNWEHAGQTAVQVDQLSALVGAAGDGLDGILGLPLLRAAVLDLDLERWTLGVSDQHPAECPAGTQPVPLGIHRGLPVIELAINAGPTEALLLDTGNPAAVVRLAADAPGNGEPGLPLPGGARLALADRVSVGAWQRALVPVLRLHAPALLRALAPSVEGLAGTALLDGMRWQIDLSQGRACMTQDAPPLPGGFGLTLVQRDGALWIDSVLDGGPAQAAGVRAGEVVTQWAGGPVSGPLRDLWARAQASSELVLRVGTDARELRLLRTHFLPRLP